MLKEKSKEKKQMQRKSDASFCVLLSKFKNRLFQYLHHFSSSKSPSQHILVTYPFGLFLAGDLGLPPMHNRQFGIRRPMTRQRLYNALSLQPCASFSDAKSCLLHPDAMPRAVNVDF